MDSFKITYVGGIGRVTGLCTLVEHGNSRFLVDCGMVQGEAHQDYENSKPFPFDPKEIKFIILTHAHLDHCGLIPRLVEHRPGFKWGKLVPIDQDLMLTFYRSAHILGSVSAVVASCLRNDSIWFSGDVGRNNREEMLQPLLKYRQGPDRRNNEVSEAM